MICDEEYPKRVAIDFLLRVHENFKFFMNQKKLDLNSIDKDTDVKFEYIATEIEAWQDPSKKDNIMKLQNELNDVQDIMRQNLNELLKREENLENLMEKSKDLSATSVNFYKQAKKTNRFFRGSQIFGVAAMSFMHGAQDGQKFMAIMLLGVAFSKDITGINFTIPIWLIIHCSIFIALGAIMGGIRVIKTIGTKVVKVEKYQGTAADISSAICLFASTTMGIPVSSTHTKNSAVMGVGASKRLSNVNWKTARNMVLTWICTFPGCGILGFALTKILINII